MITQRFVSNIDLEDDMKFPDFTGYFTHRISSSTYALTYHNNSDVETVCSSYVNVGNTITTFTQSIASDLFTSFRYYTETSSSNTTGYIVAVFKKDACILNHATVNNINIGSGSAPYYTAFMPIKSGTTVKVLVLSSNTYYGYQILYLK